jgi:hypothetical protein
MAKLSKKSKKPERGERKWHEELDAQRVGQALEEATVDCHDQHEQHSGLLTVIQDELAFPFPAVVLGERVSVVGMEWPEADEFGLDLVCERNGKQHRVEARSVDLVKPFPDGHLFFAAYLAWKRFL